MRRWQIGCAFILCVVLSEVFAAKPEAATSDARPPGQAEWESTVEAAKKEGVVIVAGPQGAYRRAPLVETFEKAFPGIKVEYTPLGGAQFVPVSSWSARRGVTCGTFTSAAPRARSR